MRRLFLIRHAKAEPAIGQDDYERALTERGRADARRVAAALAARGLLPDVLIHSGALRTKQTAEIFAAQWPRRVQLEDELGLYDATRAMLFERARALSDKTGSIGFVGHNPAHRRDRHDAGRRRRRCRVAPHRGEIPDLRRRGDRLPDRPLGRHRPQRPGALKLYLTPGELEDATD